MNIENYARNYNSVLHKFEKKERKTRSRKSEREYPDTSGFEEALAADPLNTTHRLAYSDFLRDNDMHYGAEWHKGLADWLDNTYPHAKGTSGEASIKVPASEGTHSPEPDFPFGLTFNDVIKWPRGSGGSRPKPETHPDYLRSDGTVISPLHADFLNPGPTELRWPHVNAMLNAFRDAAIAKRKWPHPKG